MYSAIPTVIHPHHELFDYMDGYARASKLLYNAVLFRLRNYMTGRAKTKQGQPLSSLEQQVFAEVTRTAQVCNKKMPRSLSFAFMLQLLKVAGVPDFFPGQIAQSVVKQACEDFSNWYKAIKVYGKNPKAFTGRPQIPGYKKSDTAGFVISNQDAVIRNGMWKLPKTKLTMIVPSCAHGRLKEVRICPYHDCYKVVLVMEIDEEEVTSPGTDIASIDFGVSNTAALVSTNHLCVLYKGGHLKSINRFYNKQIAELQNTSGLHTSNRIDAAWRNRAGRIHAICHALTSHIVNTLVQNSIGTLVVGVNKYQKQNVHLGKVNDQNFVQIPFATIRWLLQYKCERAGIVYMEQEESYTSQASFVDDDYIPTYGVDDNKAHFSGKRYQRLYQTKDGHVVNADLNGAGNILRKAFPSAFSSDRSFIDTMEVKVFCMGKYIDKKDLPTENDRIMRKTKRKTPTKASCKSIVAIRSGAVMPPRMSDSGVVTRY